MENKPELALTVLAVGYGILKTINRNALTTEQLKVLDKFAVAAEALIYSTTIKSD